MKKIVLIIIVTTIITSFIVFLAKYNEGYDNLVQENINNQQHILELEDLYENQKLKEQNLQNKIESLEKILINISPDYKTNHTLSLFNSVKIYYSEMLLKGDFVLKGKKIKNYTKYFDEKCLQPTGIDLCEGVGLIKSFNSDTKSCTTGRSGGCSSWFNYGKKTCEKACEWIKDIENIGNGYYIINGSLFFYNIPINDVDIDSFVVLDRGFSIDKNFLYFAGKKQNNIINIKDIEIYLMDGYRNHTIYVKEETRLHTYISNGFNPTYEYLGTKDINGTNNLKYINDKWVLIGNDLYLNNQKVNFFNKKTYGLNKCYIFDEDTLLFLGIKEYNMASYKGHDINSLQIHSCSLLEDKDGFIYRGFRINALEAKGLKNYKSIKESERILDEKYGRYGTVIKNHSTLPKGVSVYDSSDFIEKFGEK